MTVPTTHSVIRYAGNGATTEFDYTFKVINEDHLVVTIVEDAVDAETVLTKTTHYTVTAVDLANGSSIVLGNLTSITGSSALPSGWTVAISRSMPQTQAVDLTYQGEYSAEAFEAVFDDHVMTMQQMQEEIDRCPKVEITSGDAGSVYLTTIQAAVAAAAASESNAGSSASAASTSETNAAVSAAAALASELAAAASESAASGSASAASASESAASASASAASSSETNAATSETNADTSATNAGISETNAAASAAAALVSENNAAASETAAGISETNAEASETAAGISETNAAASAASINLPASIAGEASKLIHVNAGETGYETIALSLFHIDAANGYIGMGSATSNTDNQLHLVMDAAKDIFIDGSTNPRTVDTGVMRFSHTPSIENTRCLTLNVDVNSQASTHAAVINLTATGLASGERAIGFAVSVDTNTSTGGAVSALEVTKAGAGSADVFGLLIEAGVAPICQSAGAFGNVEQAFSYDGSYTDVTAAFNATGTDVTLFAGNGDYVYIGMASKFDAFEVNLDTVASNPGIKPTFEFSDGASGWTTFTPVDDSLGFRVSGPISWLSANLTGWATDTVNAVGSKYWVRITRTQNSLSTSPIEDTIQVATTAIYMWDTDGSITVAAVNTGLVTATVSGTPAATNTVLELVDASNAASMINTGAAILFSQYYYDATTPAKYEAGRIKCITHTNATSDTNSHDNQIVFGMAVNGTMTDRVKFRGDGSVQIVATDALLGKSGTNGTLTLSGSNSVSASGSAVITLYANLSGGNGLLAITGGQDAAGGAVEIRTGASSAARWAVDYAGDFLGQQTNNKILTSSDANTMFIGGGTATATGNGAYIKLQGNDAGGSNLGGGIDINAGNEATNGDINFSTGGNSGVMTISYAGGVGIGVAPNTALNVYDSRASDIVMRVRNSSATTPDLNFWELSAASSDNNTQYFLRADDSTTTKTFIYSDGDVWTSDAGTLTSDERHKESIVDATPKLADLMKVKIKNYSLKSDKGRKKRIGVVSQELAAIFPGLVSEHTIGMSKDHIEANYAGTFDIASLEKDEGKSKEAGDADWYKVPVKSVRYGAFIPILIKTIQEMKLEIDALKN